MTGDCVIQSLYLDGNIAGLRVIQADDLIEVNVDLLIAMSSESEFSDFTEPYLTILSVDGPVVYRLHDDVHEARNGFLCAPYRVAELVIA